METPSIINGRSHKDERGEVRFFNDFDLSKIKRMYYTEHFSTRVVRAWQAHVIESRWFLCVQGSFDIKLVQLDDFDSPSDDLPTQDFILNDKDSRVLHIPKGYANGFQAKEENSKLLIFSNFLFGVHPDDQLRYDKNKWTKWN